MAGPNWAPREAQKPQEALRSPQAVPAAPRRPQRLPEAPRSHQNGMMSQSFDGSQKPPEVAQGFRSFPELPTESPKGKRNDPRYIPRVGACFDIWRILRVGASCFRTPPSNSVAPARGIQGQTWTYCCCSVYSRSGCIVVVFASPSNFIAQARGIQGQTWTSCSRSVCSRSVRIFVACAPPQAILLAANAGVFLVAHASRTLIRTRGARPFTIERMSRWLNSSTRLSHVDFQRVVFSGQPNRFPSISILL